MKSKEEAKQKEIEDKIKSSQEMIQDLSNKMKQMTINIQDTKEALIQVWFNISSCIYVYIERVGDLQSRLL